MPDTSAQRLNRSILVADDEDAYRTILSSELDRIGYDIALAEDGEEAMTALKARAFDLVLLDIKMPKADGLEVLKFIRNNVPKTKAIIMTGYADLQIAMESKQNGALDFLVKPFNLDDLRTAIQAAGL
ncbi:MAG TPA: response regulator [Bacteroidota bacterium]|nr:response regulator [Bacteroidota bacterium]